MILDLGLPDESVLKARRSGHRTPLLITTARDQINDRIAGLDAGADDDEVTPFDRRDLAAGIRTMPGHHAPQRRGRGD